MKLRPWVGLIIPFMLLSGCQKTNHQKPVHHQKTKVVKKIVYVHRKKHNNKKLKPVPSIANLKDHYHILNNPVVVLTFHNKPNEDIGTQMTNYLNHTVNIDQYHVQTSTSGNTTYVTLKYY